VSIEKKEGDKTEQERKEEKEGAKLTKSGIQKKKKKTIIQIHNQNTKSLTVTTNFSWKKILEFLCSL
jgi:hypothetical protein